MASSAFVTRFAPSPTGHLHLGHAYSALTAYRRARAEGGRLLLRIEDIDTGRCRPEYEEQILDDLAWLGITFDGPVRRQSEHLDDYTDALERLRMAGVVYPCFCTRKQIRTEIRRSKSAPHGPEGVLYPGTCRDMAGQAREALLEAGRPHALRLDVGRAVARLQAAGQWPLSWDEEGLGRITAQTQDLGDVVLARKDVSTSYHLAVTVDDGLQGITHVIRGRDLLHCTHVHRLLQALLGLQAPVYHHHDLVADRDGRRLAKRDGTMTIMAMRSAGLRPDEVTGRMAASLRPGG